MAGPSIAAFLLPVLISAALAVPFDSDTAAEIESLTAIRVALRDPLNALVGWDPSTPSAPCDWIGVTCDGRRRVSELRLPNLQLAGSLSPEIANLRMLRNLNLRSNSLNGTIPSAVFRCALLRSVFLQQNLLTGAIPPEIYGLGDLFFFNAAGNRLSGEIPGALPASIRFLDLSSNYLLGGIPGNISSASQLQLINLSDNRIFGEIPPSLGELQNLHYISLDYNSLGGTLPSALANCSALVHFSAKGNSIGGVLTAAIGILPMLQVVSLSHNNLSGSIPGSFFCNLSYYPPSIRVLELDLNSFSGIDRPKSVMCSNNAMQGLGLENNQLFGAFPVFLTNFTSLTSLNLSGNLFSDPLPREIGHMRQLEVLKLANNSFDGLVPPDISNCSNLRILDLEGNHFSGAIPSFVIELINLRVLSLGRNNFSGPITWSFRNLTALESLSLRDNGLIGSLPEGLMNLIHLTTLDLSGNRFVGSIPTSIEILRQIEVLNLSGNRISGAIPESIGNLFKLTTLDLSKQNMSGALPLYLLGLPNLQVIALQENSFSGEVPEGLSSLIGLRYLNLSFNSFSGHIPPTFGFLRSLVVISISNNHISGPVITQLGKCSSLEVVDLRSNALTGEIPSELSELSHLKTLDLGENNLTGRIPVEISNCSSLISLLLDANHLTGPIPAALGLRFQNQSSFIGNPSLCGAPLDSKCDKSGNNDGEKNNRLIMLVAVAAAGTLFVLSCCCFYVHSFLRWRERIRDSQSGENKPRSPARGSSRSSGHRSSENGLGPPRLVMFNDKITIGETLQAMRQFDEDNVLSRSRHGVLFKACYNDGMVLTIRRLPDGGSHLDPIAFRKEVESLGRVKHKNLTVLRGYYVASRPGLRLLAHDYMPNGNLETLLQEAALQDGHVLNWPMRHLIALGIARGLAHLHLVPMAHGDVKPKNVLFDADFEAHLSDFGLDRLLGSTLPEASKSSALGTLGYMAPEAASTREADVYGFGIVVLELLTGRRPVMFRDGDEDIVKWVKRQLQGGQVAELLEPGLLELDPESSEWEEFLMGIKVGLLCTAPDPMDRPTMADVVFMLEGCRVGPDAASSADPQSQHSPSQPQFASKA